MLCGAVLLVVGVVRNLYIKYKPFTKVREILDVDSGDKIVKNANTDKPAPVGFSKHYQLIVDTAPTASPADREKYALANMTESDVLLAERSRLEKLAVKLQELKNNKSTEGK